MSFFINENTYVSGKWNHPAKLDQVHMKQIFKGKRVKEIECGNNYGFAVTHDNLAIGWGDNKFK